MCCAGYNNAHAWHLRLVPNSALTRFNPRSVRVAWVKCIALATRALGATSQLKSFRWRFPVIKTVFAASSKRHGPQRAESSEYPGSLRHRHLPRLTIFGNGTSGRGDASAADSSADAGRQSIMLCNARGDRSARKASSTATSRNFHSDGRVKILDFGLAKLTPEGDFHRRYSNPDSQTGAGMVLGTFAYMSPEQVRGKAADARSDLFSLGATLYEMVSGRRPFRGDTAADTMSAILKDEPRPLGKCNKTLLPGSCASSIIVWRKIRATVFNGA